MQVEHPRAQRVDRPGVVAHAEARDLYNGVLAARKLLHAGAPLLEVLGVPLPRESGVVDADREAGVGLRQTRKCGHLVDQRVVTEHEAELGERPARSHQTASER